VCQFRWLQYIDFSFHELVLFFSCWKQRSMEAGNVPLKSAANVRSVPLPVFQSSKDYIYVIYLHYNGYEEFYRLGYNAV
jgi:hypothetical protein